MRQILYFRAVAIASMFVMCITICLAQSKSHTVARGETLQSVAQKYGVSEDAIRQANPNMGNMFYVGMKLDIPEKSEQNSGKRKKVKVQKEEVPAQPPIVKEEKWEVKNTNLPSSTLKSTDSEDKVKDGLWHIDYYNSLKSGDKGAYGFGADGLGNKEEGFGISMRIYTNLFLVDSDFSQFVTAWGANYHLKIENVGYILFPVMLSIYGYNAISFDDKGKKETKTKIGTGLLVSPYIAIGKKYGINIGPTFYVDFVNGESSWGGYIGIWF